MIVRHPTREELERAGEIGFIAFAELDLEHWVNSYIRRADAFGLEYLFVVEDEGQIVSSLLCTPGPIWIGDDTVTHSAVGAVATVPEYRKRGCAGLMMTETVKSLRSLGIYTSSLWPFSYRYYRKFGWEVGGEVRIYKAKPEVFAGLGDPSSVRIAGEQDLPGIMSCYNSFAPNYAGLTVRHERWWYGMQEEGLVLDSKVAEDGKRRILCLGQGSNVDAYATFSIGTHEEKKYLEIQELAANTPEATFALLARAAQEFVDYISLYSPVNDLLFQQLEDPRQVELTIQTGFQFRVIDPPQALASRKAQRDEVGKIRFNLTDPVFPEGWSFTVELESGHITISDAETEGTFSTSVQIFARLFSGYLRPQDAINMNRASASSDEALMLAETVFRPLVPFRSYMEPG